MEGKGAQYTFLNTAMQSKAKEKYFQSCSLILHSGITWVSRIQLLLRLCLETGPWLSLIRQTDEVSYICLFLNMVSSFLKILDGHNLPTQNFIKG